MVRIEISNDGTDEIPGLGKEGKIVIGEAPLSLHDEIIQLLKDTGFPRDYKLIKS
jgi:hypothetical protein